MKYILTGFTHRQAFRVYAFDGVTDGWERTAFSIEADLVLARKYGIRVQELPLLCRAVLEHRTEGDGQRAFTYTEGDMSLQSTLRALQDASKKKGPRQPPAVVTG